MGPGSEGEKSGTCPYYGDLVSGRHYVLFSGGDNSKLRTHRNTGHWCQGNLAEGGMNIHFLDRGKKVWRRQRWKGVGETNGFASTSVIKERETRGASASSPLQSLASWFCFSFLVLIDFLCCFSRLSRALSAKNRSFIILEYPFLSYDGWARQRFRGEKGPPDREDGR